MSFSGSISQLAGQGIPAGNIYASPLGASQQGVQIISKPINTTRVLLLSGFAPELKTRDLVAFFSEWEDLNGGYRIKWIDDRSAYIVFNDASVAKRAFLATIADPPPSLAATSTSPAAVIVPYTGPDTETILQAVATRPRSRSIAQPNGGSHARRPSGNNAPAATGHGRRTSDGFANGFTFGRPAGSVTHDESAVAA